MSDKNNGPAANTWGTDSNKQDNTSSQPGPLDTKLIKQKKKQINHKDEKRVFTRGASDKQTMELN